MSLLHVQGGQWVGEECVFEFSARGRASSGVVRADWRRPVARIELSDGRDADLPHRHLLVRSAVHVDGRGEAG